MLVESQLPGWSVDVEYDKWHRDGIEAVKKVLRRHEPADDGVGEHDVYPDVVVHRRSGSTAEYNLLVVEVKKQESPGHDRDRAKLRAFLMEPFCYQHAAFLTLPADGACPTLEWITTA